jgi:hypothetical protein
VGADLTQIRGHSLFDVGSGVFGAPELRSLLIEVVTQGRVIDAFEIEHDGGPTAAQRMLLNARRLEQVGTNTSHVLVALQSVTADSDFVPL